MTCSSVPHLQATEEAIHHCASRSKNYDIGMEVVKLDYRCSWESQSRRVGARVGDDSTEARSVVQPLHLPSLIHPEHSTHVVVFR